MGGQNGSTGGKHHDLTSSCDRTAWGGSCSGAVAFTLCGAPVALALSPEARNAKLDETIRGLVEGHSTPGIVVLILQNGRPVYSRSVGVRQAGSTAPIGENDMFRLASMTKAVTSVAAMILIEQGKIGLEDPVPVANLLTGG
jgi:CubicO group peptidase (beta-lactamase class C family)